MAVLRSVQVRNCRSRPFAEKARTTAAVDFSFFFLFRCFDENDSDENEANLIKSRKYQRAQIKYFGSEIIRF